jgi:hypothetical protein
MNADVEKFLQDTIFPDLEEGRPNWDKPHTEAVVSYMKEIIENVPSLKEMEDVLIISAYAHDWGYAGLFHDGKPVDIERIKESKKLHMILGAEKIKNLLKEPIFDYLSKEQKERIIHLVRVHDRLDDYLKAEDELTLFEADLMGMLDVVKVKPTFDKETNDSWMQVCRKQRFHQLYHEYSRKKVEELFAERMAYFEDK